MPPEKKPNVKKAAVFLVKSGIAALLLYLLLRKTQCDVFAGYFRGIVLWWVAAAGALHIIGYLVSAHRWGILLKAQGLTPSFWELVKSYVIATQGL